MGIDLGDYLWHRWHVIVTMATGAVRENLFICSLKQSNHAQPKFLQRQSIYIYIYIYIYIHIYIYIYIYIYLYAYIYI